MANQPEWQCIAQLGDVHPIDHGGYWVFRDTTGVYCEEGEYLEVPEDEDGEYRVYRFILERCTFENGVLSDNKFHPDKPAWFAKTEEQRKKRPQDTTYLKNIADYVGLTQADIINILISENAVDRAQAYRSIGEYHGFENLDGYPLTLSRDEAEERYRSKKYSVV